MRAFVDGPCLFNQRTVPPFRTKITETDDATTADAQSVGLHQPPATVEGKSIFAQAGNAGQRARCRLASQAARLLDDRRANRGG